MRLVNAQLGLGSVIGFPESTQQFIYFNRSVRLFEYLLFSLTRCVGLMCKTSSMPLTLTGKRAHLAVYTLTQLEMVREEILVLLRR